EFAALVDALDAARQGRPAVLLVRGEAGIGKSRLIEEFSEYARSVGAAVATGRCVPSGTRSLSYAPFMEILQELLEQLDDPDAALPPQVRRSIAPLLGEADSTVATPVIGPDLGLSRMFAGTTETIAIASATRPALIVLEDAHWADPSSVDLLDFIARRLRDQAVLLIVTVRSNDRSVRAEKRLALAELLRLPSTSELYLEPLPGAAIDTLLKGQPQQLSAEVREQIARLCDGNPFFALHLATRGGLGGTLSPALRETLLAPLDELDVLPHDTLYLLAVLGRPAGQDLLIAGLEWPAADLNDALRLLVEHGLVSVRGNEVTLRHALVREALLDEMLPSERVVAHYRSAEGILATGGRDDPERAEELSIHLLGCGRPMDAVTYALSGARYAARVWAFADARRLYAAVLRLWPVVSTADGLVRAALPHQADLLAEAAMVNRWAGALDDAVSLVAQARALPNLSTAQRARLAHTRGQVLWAAGDMEGSLEAYIEAEASLPDNGEHQQLRVGVLAALAGARMMTGQAEQALHTAERAITLARTVGAYREELHATITTGVALAQLGSLDEAVATLERCLPIVRERDELDLVVRCYGNLTFVLTNAGRYEQADRVAQEGEDVCHRYGPILSVASTIVNNHTTALIRLGRWDEARVLANRALDEAMPEGIALSLHLTLAEIAAIQGDDAEVDLQLTHATQLDPNDPYARSTVLTARAEQRLWKHDPSGALREVEATLPVLERQEDALPLVNACWLGLRARADLADLGNRPRRHSADDDTAHLLELARATSEVNVPTVTALLTMCEAEARRIAGADTDVDWNSAAEANDLLRSPYMRAYSLYRLAVCQLRRRA
ncbi:MAG: hypothetical protein QOH17_5030, partial [Pseudonocardiales bacterium]|nr:hypothetical protein [Pseudonocardiales bacterium]